VFSETSTRSLGPTQPPIQRVPGFFSGGISGWDVKLTTHICVVPRLRMSGGAPLLPLYTFTAWRGKTLPFTVPTNDGTERWASSHEIGRIAGGGGRGGRTQKEHIRKICRTAPHASTYFLPCHRRSHTECMSRLYWLMTCLVVNKLLVSQSNETITFICRAFIRAASCAVKCNLLQQCLFITLCIILKESEICLNNSTNWRILWH
jgi:hypothetical protein